MTAVFICTHGTLGSGLLDTTQMICGEQQNCAVALFKMGADVDDFRKEIVAQLQQFSSDEPIMATVDLKGGTPFNVLVSLIPQFPNLEILTGANVPMLLQLFLQRESLPLEQLKTEAIEAAKMGIDQYDQQTTLNQVDDEEDF